MITLDRAKRIANEIISKLKKMGIKGYIVGSIAREEPKVGDIDIVIEGTEHKYYKLKFRGVQVDFFESPKKDLKNVIERRTQSKGHIIQTHLKNTMYK